MDELEFRRKLYVNPHTEDDAIKEAAASDPKKREFIQELRKLDQKMQHASQVEVPKDLASKLILRQTLHSHKTNKRRNRVQLALAASVAFVMGISFTMWQQQSLINLTENAIAHVIAEGDHALAANERVSVAQVNAKLASFGAELLDDVGEIYYANFCDFDNVRSLHMVMQVGEHKLTVFIVPRNDDYDSESGAKGKQYNSEAVDFNHASLVVVGKAGADITKAKQHLSQKFKFSA